MRKIFWLLCLFTVLTNAQIRELELHFDTDSFVLSQAESSKLNQFIQSFDDRQNLTVAIAGHTDSVGDVAYNAVLSDRRAQTIATAFGQNGFDEKNITTSGRGEVHPVAPNDHESGKAKNRRVVVKVFRPIIASNTIGNKTETIADKPGTENGKVNHIAGFKRDQTNFTVDAENPQTLTYTSGTKISIPPDAFVDKDGRQVTGKVDLKYIEYRDPIDFILSNIPMDHGGGTFNSGGMFKIVAYQNGQQVYLGKDKKIDLEFPITANAPDMNFYQLDTIANQWKELSPIRPENGTLTIRPTGLVKTALNYSCSNDPCTAAGYVRQKGKKLAAMETSVYQYYIDYQKKLDTTKAVVKTKQEQVWVDAGTNPGYMTPGQGVKVYERIIKAQQRRLKRFPVQFQRLAATYTVSKSEHAPDKTRFRIQFNAAYNVKAAEFQNTEWIAEQAAELPEQLYTKKWDSCIISGSGEGFYKIVLKDSAETVTVAPVSFKNENVRKTAEDKFIASLNSGMAIQQKKLRRIAEAKTVVDEDIVYAEQKIKELKDGTYSTTYNRSLDELKCFWEKNRDYMPPRELTMTIDQWFRHFDQNKALMADRYDDITPSRECLKRLELQQKMEKMQNNANALTQSLSISNLGVYNCDQIARLREPLIADMDYRDEQGKKIKPTFIYLVDSQINGIFRYGGGEYTPFHFAYSPKSENTLLAFAEDEAYIVSAEDFKKTMQSRSGYFTLRKVEKMETKEDLAVQF